MAKEIPAPQSLEELADLQRLAKIAVSLTRYVRPTVNIVRFPSETFYSIYDLDSGIYDAMVKSSISPLHNIGLRKKVEEVALGMFPNYEEVKRRREAKQSDLETLTH